MLRDITRIGLLVAAFALLGALILGCGQSGPTVPSPDGGPIPTAAEGSVAPAIPAGGATGLPDNAIASDFTICEEPEAVTADAADQVDCSRPIICFDNTIQTGGNTDMVVVLDHSGSMAAEVSPGVTRLDATKDAAQLLVSLMRSGDRAELIQFDGDVEVLVPFTNDQNALNTAIEGIDYGGVTAAWDAGRQAVADLVANGRPTAVRAVLLMTDGDDNSSQPDPDSARAQLIADAQAAGYPVYTVALGGGISTVGQAALQEVADQTGGEFLQANTAQELQAAFQQFFQTVTQGGYVMAWTSAFAPGTRAHVVIYYHRNQADERIVFDQVIVTQPAGTYCGSD
jgi:hypothetical protein